jgi:hypothetical protein
MKLSVLVTSLVLGISSVAAAAPHAPAVHANANLVAQARFAPPMTRPVAHPVKWMLLDTAKPSRFGRTVIDVNTKLRFSKLKLEALRGGVSSIDKVLITYANGRTQTVDLDARLGGFGSNSFKIIELDGRMSRQITKIVIVSKSRARGSYSISAA